MYRRFLQDCMCWWFRTIPGLKAPSFTRTRTSLSSSLKFKLNAKFSRITQPTIELLPFLPLTQVRDNSWDSCLGLRDRNQENRIRTQDFLLESRFCHFEMRCRAPIGKSPLPFASQDFSHPFEMTLGTFYPSLFPFGQLPVRFVSLRLPARPAGGRSATGLSFLAERSISNHSHSSKWTITEQSPCFCPQLNEGSSQEIGKTRAFIPKC